ncbi:hypothetical protein KQR54_18125 [Mycobacterium gordonae]|nr:hypothetical protein [Mycobacterium gordonae]
MNTVDGKNPEITFELGKEIRFFSEGIELFRGVLFRKSVDSTGSTTLTAHDESLYLKKNTDTRRFTKATASQIVRQLCADFGITAGTIADTAYVIPKLILRDKTLWEMITIALTLTFKNGGRRFFVYADKGVLNLAERKTRRAAFVIESATNMTGATYTQSIEDMRNRVRVIGGDPDKKPVSTTASDGTSAAKYGIMQHLENAPYDATLAQVKQLAARLLTEMNVIDDEARVESIGYDDTYAGVSVYVYDKMTGIIGSYYVSSDTHTYSDGLHTMSLTLSATDDLPTLEYVPPPEVNAK